jgi:hypothetical protein
MKLAWIVFLLLGLTSVGPASPQSQPLQSASTISSMVDR